MRSKTIWLIGFIVMALAQIVIPLQQIFRWNEILEEGAVYKFLVEPVDPVDPLRGEYITLNFKENKWDILRGQRDKKMKRIFVTIANDSTGYAVIEDVSYDEPSDTIDYINALIEYEFNNADNRKQIRISYPFDKFYMPETKAAQTEQMYMESLMDSSKIVYAQVRIKNGTGVLEDVIIDGKSVLIYAQ